MFEWLWKGRPAPTLVFVAGVSELFVVPSDLLWVCLISIGLSPLLFTVSYLI